jgi:hypothetical protein
VNAVASVGPAQPTPHVAAKPAGPAITAPVGAIVVHHRMQVATHALYAAAAAKGPASTGIIIVKSSNRTELNCIAMIRCRALSALDTRS